MAGCIDLTAGSIRRECVDRTLITGTCGVQTLLSIMEAVWAGRGETEISYWLVPWWAGKQALQIQREPLCKKIKTEEEKNRRPREKHTQDGLYVVVLLFFKVMLNLLS